MTADGCDAGIIREALRDWFKKHRVPVTQTGHKRAITRKAALTINLG